MKISIDYDKTFTRDPKFWTEFITLCELYGHEIICVTNRPFPMKPSENLIPKHIKILYAGAEYKMDYAKSQGHKVDIWIDDMPGTICKSLELP